MPKPTNCKIRKEGHVKAPLIKLESGGGFLRDGFKLGRLLRKSNATVLIEKGKICASSCAVAFLGGVNRAIDETSKILFHAPYYMERNGLGVEVVDCEVPDELLLELREYYTDMVGKKAGDRLYDRTMSYCTASDGWVVTGPSAARLFKITTK